MRESQLLERLRDGFDVDLFVVTEHFERDLASLPLAAPFLCAVSVYESESPAPAGVGGGVRGSYASAALDAKLSRVIGNYDLVHIEGYFLVPHVPAGTDRPIVLVEENIEYLLDAQAVRAYGCAAHGRASVTRRAELAAWSRAAKIVMLTEEDASVARQAVGDDRLSVVPNGYGHTGLGAATDGGGSDVLVVGNYDWWPTQEGLTWLVDEVWPLVLRARPGARLTVVGAGDTSAVTSRCADLNISVAGTVPDVWPFLANCAVFAGPSRFGSGVKVKMIEAAAAGCAIVATSASLRGLPRAAREAIDVADDAPGFARALVRLLDDARRRASMRRRMSGTMIGQATWDDAAQGMAKVWSEALAYAGQG